MKKSTSVFQLSCAPIPLVRIGLIGVGQRGTQTLRRYADIEGAEIRAMASLDEMSLHRANRELVASARPEAKVFSGEDAWKEICEQDDLDLIYICTDWRSHAKIACWAMECGKHVAVEVPAATTVSECWDLVEAAERTRRHCFMTENCCYDWVTLATLSLQADGFFGSITHCEGAYIHDWRELFADSNPMARAWYSDSCTHGGNPYPTHGIGPIAQLLGFHRRDRMCHLVSMTGQADGVRSLLGHANHTLISTEQGVTILLQFDGTTPRPYSRNQMVCGTLGFVQKYPLLQVQTESLAHQAAAAEQFLRSQLTTPAAQLWLEGERRGVNNAMNFAMDMRLISALRSGSLLDIDVYDAAEWSCLAELSRLSAERGGERVAVPDFLHGERED